MIVKVGVKKEKDDEFRRRNAEEQEIGTSPRHSKARGVVSVVQTCGYCHDQNGTPFSRYFRDDFRACT